MPGSTVVDAANKVFPQDRDEHPECSLLAFVYGDPGDHDLLAMRSKAEMCLLLVALNLPECFAAVGTAAAIR